MDPVPDDFLGTLDAMIESTEEFILDDTSGDEPKAVLDQLVRNNEAGVADRMKDLLALEHVRELYTDAFQTQED
jgi:polyhydroxyalkanoate synthesis regulator protein